ncbi:hypothetical protein [Beggiatoa leptomitoformis]|uniref:DUF1737 domain-containing protein n=1 Tax=Beggiatoa leptomitoformis TaxID=288004 RepID=A0A2N9YAC3_9GAMM|nr:hypothetical protein [Beggiatoa leptomitoformis]ALG67187.1 hypothetical protein AL038_05010 [Beggiatoa leptomitoformis]AUI67407.1 hypothetical protein BLE401_00985 [Beggiatoa leptomitoformis]
MAEKTPKQRYIVIMDSSSVGITKSVNLMVNQINTKITEGYIPHGNLVAVADDDGNPSFFQPMILRAPTPPASK